MFGLGANAQATQAIGFRGDAGRRQQSRAASALPRPAITPASVAGDTIVSAGDNSGAIALQNVITTSQSFHAAGGIAAQTASLSDYAATFYQNLSTQSNSVTANQTTQDDRLQRSQFPRRRPIRASIWTRS